MAITEESIALFESERMIDETDGGGQVSNRRILGGVINNLFADIDHLARARGRFECRKIYAGIETNTTEPFKAAHVIVAKRPADASVDCLLVAATDFEQERAALRESLETIQTNSTGSASGGYSRSAYCGVNGGNYYSGIGVYDEATPSGTVPAKTLAFVAKTAMGLWDGASAQPPVPTVPAVGDKVLVEYVPLNVGNIVQQALGLYGDSSWQLSMGSGLQTVQQFVTVASVVTLPRTTRVTANGETFFFDKIIITTVEDLMLAAPTTARFGGMLAMKNLPVTGSTNQKAGPKMYGTQPLTAASAINNKTLTIASTSGQVAPPVIGAVSPEEIGIDNTKLPADGRVPIFRPGDVVVIGDQQTKVAPAGLASGQIINIGRTNLDIVQVEDANGASVPLDRYVIDKAAGTVTMAANLDLSAYVQPLQIIHRIEEMRSVMAVDPIAKTVLLDRGLTKAYPIGALLASALVLPGEAIRARVLYTFAQQAWTSVWQDTLIGGTPAAQYDDVTNPIQVQNRSAVQERWRVVFTSANTVSVYGERLGQVLNNVGVNSDIAPINPATGLPYFVIKAAGWGNGWVVSNVLRFNTEAARKPFWLTRAVVASESAGTADTMRIQVRGDVAAQG